jgi:hypothetical protein
MIRIRFDGCDLSLSARHPGGRTLASASMQRLPPALAASATPRILELLGDGPGRVLELGFAGIHARLLELAGWEVIVVEPDPAAAARARERGARVAERVEGRFDAVVAPTDADLTGVDAVRLVFVDQDGSVREER